MTERKQGNINIENYNICRTKNCVKILPGGRNKLVFLIAFSYWKKTNKDILTTIICNVTIHIPNKKIV